MALQDSDNFIVSDASGTNYKINATSLATYINAQSSGGGGGSVGGGGGTTPYGYVKNLTSAAGGMENSGAVMLKSPPGNGLSQTPAHGKAFITQEDNNYCYFEVAGVSGIDKPNQGFITYKMYGARPAVESVGDLWRVEYAVNGGLFSCFLRSYHEAGHMDSNDVSSWHIQTLTVGSGTFMFGCTTSAKPTEYANLQGVRGKGSITSARNLPSLKNIDSTITITGVEVGDYDFRDTALSAETIVNWLSKLDLDTQDFKSRYFKTLRFDGGTAANYEDLPTGVRNRISELQDLGYTIVMNGTGDATTINVSAGNVALIIETSDGRYVPIKASTSAAIFPPTGYTNVTQYAGLMAAKTALDSQGVTFKPERLFDELQGSLPSISGHVIVTLGSAVSLDSTLSSNPENATVTYKWFKQSSDNSIDEEIPNAEDPTIQTASITEDQLGTYKCQVTLYHAATGRWLTLTNLFDVKLADVATPLSYFIGANAVDSVSIVTSGTGYTVDATDVATTGGSGSGLTVDYTTDGDGLLTVTVNNPGEGYTDGDNITVNGGNNDATINCTVN